MKVRMKVRMALRRRPLARRSCSMPVFGEEEEAAFGGGLLEEDVADVGVLAADAGVLLPELPVVDTDAIEDTQLDDAEDTQLDDAEDTQLDDAVEALSRSRSAFAALTAYVQQAHSQTAYVEQVPAYVEQVDSQPAYVEQWLQRDAAEEARSRSRSPSPATAAVLLPVPEERQEEHSRRPCVSTSEMPSFSTAELLAHVELMQHPGRVLRRRVDSAGRAADLERLWQDPRIFVRLPDASADAFAHCRQQVSAIARVGGGRAFYIGITEDPPRRWEEHQRVYSGGMVVLIEASSSRITSDLEVRLLEVFLPRPGILSAGHSLCRNMGRGGERASAGSPHYLYVVYRPDVLLRR